MASRSGRTSFHVAPIKSNPTPPPSAADARTWRNGAASRIIKESPAAVAIDIAAGNRMSAIGVSGTKSSAAKTIAGVITASRTTRRRRRFPALRMRRKLR